MIAVLRFVGTLFAESLPGRLATLLFDAILSLFQGQRMSLRSLLDTFVNQVLFTAVEIAPIVLGVGLLLGGVTIVQAASVMPKIGSGAYLGSVMVLVVVRELAPIFTAFFVAGRTGSALAAFIGNMKVSNEIDGLESMGIDPVRFLVLPALLGCTAGLVCLSILFTAVAIAGGYAVALLLSRAMPDYVALQMDFGLFMEMIVAALKPFDFLVLFLKPLIFGLLIALIACHNGLSLRISSHEVPKGTRRAVVQCFVMIVLLDGAFALAVFVPALAGALP